MGLIKSEAVANVSEVKAFSQILKNTAGISILYPTLIGFFEDLEDQIKRQENMYTKDSK